MLEMVNRDAVERDGDGGKTWRQTGATGKTSLPTGEFGNPGERPLAQLWNIDNGYTFSNLLFSR